MLELAELIWRKIKGPDVPFRYVSDTPFDHDVQRRVPSVEKAQRRARVRGDHAAVRRSSTRSSRGSRRPWPTG